jgi:hypothetical protein
MVVLWPNLVALSQVQVFYALTLKIKCRIVSWVDKEATRSFMSPKLTRDLGFATCRAGKPINAQFGKDEPHDINEVALHATL